MAEYETGKMDISAQQETYESFWTWTIRTAVICVVILGVAYVAFA